MRLIVGSAIVLGVVVSGRGATMDDPPAQGAPAQAMPAPAATKPDPAAELAAWVAEHKGEIEEIAGAKLGGEIPVRVASTDELAQKIAASLEMDMIGATRPNGKPMTPIELHVRATAAAYKVATRTFGLYSRDEKVVYAIPENVRVYGKKYGWSEETIARAPRLALAHELVHAIQEQKCGLGERLAKTSGEERGALMAVSEGQAVWVTDQLAAKLDWGAANSVLWGLVSGVSDEDEPQLKAKQAKPSPLAPGAELYTLGKAMVVYHAAYTGDGPKGAERVWAILSHPPTTLAGLKDPAKFEVKGDGAGSKPTPPPPADAPGPSKGP
jgi:hypothetical protein